VELAEVNDQILGLAELTLSYSLFCVLIALLGRVLWFHMSNVHLTSICTSATWWFSDSGKPGRHHV